MRFFSTVVGTDSDVKQGHVRLGEHTDYGSITLVFQDNVGGLQVSMRFCSSFVTEIKLDTSFLLRTTPKQFRVYDMHCWNSSEAPCTVCISHRILQMLRAVWQRHLWSGWSAVFERQEKTSSVTVTGSVCNVTKIESDFGKQTFWCL